MGMPPTVARSARGGESRSARHSQLGGLHDQLQRVRAKPRSRGAVPGCPDHDGPAAYSLHGAFGAPSH